MRFRILTFRKFGRLGRTCLRRGASITERVQEPPLSDGKNCLKRAARPTGLGQEGPPRNGNNAEAKQDERYLASQDYFTGILERKCFHRAVRPSVHPLRGGRGRFLF